MALQFQAIYIQSMPVQDALQNYSVKLCEVMCIADKTPVSPGLNKSVRPIQVTLRCIFALVWRILHCMLAGSQDLPSRICSTVRYMRCSAGQIG